MDRLRLVIGWMVTLTWLLSVILDATVSTYDVPASVHGLMLLVAGAFFGPTIMGRDKNGR